VVFAAEEPVGADLEGVSELGQGPDFDMLADPGFQATHVHLILADTVAECLLGHMELVAACADTVSS
jgi:hypothetical protein